MSNMVKSCIWGFEEFSSGKQDRCGESDESLTVPTSRCRRAIVISVLLIHTRRTKLLASQGNIKAVVVILQTGVDSNIILIQLCSHPCRANTSKSSTRLISAQPGGICA